MSVDLLAHAEAARGFMPPDEGRALFEAGAAICAEREAATLLEVGSYCGKSSIYLGAAAKAGGGVLFALDHHRGSEENQAGWEHHEPDLVDEAIGRMDTLPHFRRAVHSAGLEPNVVALVGDSPTVGSRWKTPLDLLFIDGGHGVEPARADYSIWTPWVSPGGVLCIHDVFPDPADGGRPPYEEIYLPAIEAGFVLESSTGSLRVLRRPADD